MTKEEQIAYKHEQDLEHCGHLFGDEAHIIYVNGTYRGDDPWGQLMRDFHCTEPEKMYYNVLKDRVSYFKKTKEGEEIMCRAIEEMRNQEREEGRIEGKIEGKTETMISLVRDGLIAFFKRKI